MSKRLHNFNAGPAALPISVLEKVQKNLVSHNGLGVSVMEMSHRSGDFDAIIEQAKADLTELYGLPDTHEVLFMAGGASLQFAMIPMNLGGGGAYINTGTWSSKAVKEAQLIGEASEIWSGKANSFKTVPRQGDFEVPTGANYLHYTTNNTIYGTQYDYVPTADVPLIADMSSDILARPIDVTPFDLIYAGAQKNAGPSGLVVVIARKTVSREFRGAATVPNILRYKTHADKDSMFNTPNTFGIYVLSEVLKWVKGLGGLAAVHEMNVAKAKILYDVIDERADLFSGHATTESRSLMNVTFTMQTKAQEAELFAQATAAGMIGVKGHRSVGGLRASIYNAVPVESIQALANLMREFKG